MTWRDVWLHAVLALICSPFAIIHHTEWLGLACAAAVGANIAFALAVVRDVMQYGHNE